MSLLDYARTADAYPAAPSPLPPQTARRVVREHGFPTPTAWPVDLLPAALIAADLLARGVTFRRGIGYAEHGVEREPDQIARLAARILDEAADLLPTTSGAEWEHYLAETVPQVEESVWTTLAEGYGDGSIDDEHAASLVSLVIDRWNADDEAARLSLPARAETDARNLADARALRRTADDLRVSRAARRRLLDAVRPHLIEQHAEDEQDDAAALAWLKGFDACETLRRSELAALYPEAGSPGALPPARLRVLAETRWGAAVKVRGHYLHRPALAVIPPAVVSLNSRRGGRS